MAALLKTHVRNGVDLAGSRTLEALNELAWAAIEDGAADRQEATLAVASMLRDFTREFERGAVKMARSTGWSWERIASCLGESKQVVHQRHAIHSPTPSTREVRARYLGRAVAVHCEQCGRHVGSSFTGDTASLSAKVIERHESACHSTSRVDRTAVAAAKDDLRRGDRVASAGRYRFES